MIEFTSYTKPEYVVAPHHVLIAERLDSVVRGAGKRIYIGMPPRHGKSELSSVRFPAFYLGHYPEREVLHISYAGSLSNEFSRQVRQLIRDDPHYRRLFPHIKLDPERARLDDWRTVQGGGFRSVGVEAGISGRGAHLILIDDPMKEGDEHSPATMENIFSWYLSAARLRLAPGGSIVIIMTRWHPLDLIGRLLALAKEQPQADQWESLVLPGLALADDPLGRQEGAALWPERFNREALLSLKAMSDRYFQALFQQNPQGSETTLFRAEDFRMAERVPQGTRGAWTFDLAISERDRADYNTWGRWQYRKPYLFVSHIGRERQEWPTTKQRIIELMATQPRDVFVFPKQTYELMAVQELRALDLDYTNRRLRRQNLPELAHDYANRIVQVDLPGDKRSRAAVYADVVAAGRAVVENSANGRYFAFEHGNYEGLDHDDHVDMSSVATHYFGIGKEFLDLVVLGGRGESAAKLVS